MRITPGALSLLATQGWILLPGQGACILTIESLDPLFSAYTCCPQIIAPLLRVLEKMSALRLMHRDIKVSLSLDGLREFCMRLRCLLHGWWSKLIHYQPPHCSEPDLNGTTPV